MSEEISFDVLVRAMTKAERVVLREELENDNKRVTQAVLKLALEDLGVKKGSGEKRVISVGKG